MTTATADSRTIQFHQTPLGWFESQWTEAGLYSLRLVDSEPAFEDRMTNDHSLAQALDDRLHDYFATGGASFDDVRIDCTGWTPFSQSIYGRCRQIQPGTTITYKELAGRAGNIAASRAVGAAMARNRILLVIPCHRVVSSSGGLRGFSAPGGLDTKRYLLDLETR